MISYLNHQALALLVSAFFCFQPTLVQPAFSSWFSRRSATIYEAAQTGDVAGIRKMARKKKINKLDSSGRTALHYAVFADQLEAARVLLDEYEADVTATDANGSTPLNIAASHANVAMGELLLEKGAEANNKHQTNFSPLYHACYQGKEDFARFLLEHGADITYGNKRTEEKPLAAACRNGHLSLAQLLVDSDSNVGKPDTNGYTPLHACATAVDQKMDQPDDDAKYTIAKLLLAHGTPIHTECHAGTHETAGMTALQLAAYCGQAGVIRALTEDGDIDLNGYGSNPRTPLYLAVAQNHKQVVNLLLDAGATVNAPNPDGKTALFAASLNGRITLTRRLLKAGANRLKRDNKGRSASFYNLKKNSTIKRLLEGQYVANDPFAQIIGLDTVKTELVAAIEEFKAEIRSSAAGPSEPADESSPGGGALDAQLPEDYDPYLDDAPNKSPIGALLCGPPGVGKTMLAQAAAEACGCSFISLKSSEVGTTYQNSGQLKIAQVFEQARKKKPCILFLDEVDAIAPKRSGGTYVHQADIKTTNALLQELQGFDASTGVFVLAATNFPELLDDAFRQRFTITITIPLPTYDEREEMLDTMFGKHPHVTTSPEFMSRLTQKTHGCSPRVLANIVDNAARQARKDERYCITQADIATAFGITVLSEEPSLGTVEGVTLLADSDDRITLDNLVLSQNLQRELEQVVAQINAADVLRQQALQPIRGIALCGPRGTGSTTIAKAIATMTGHSFFNVAHKLTSPDTVQGVFEEAKRYLPCVIHVEAIEYLQANEHIASQFVQELSNTEHIVVIGSTTQQPQTLGGVIHNNLEVIELTLPESEERVGLIRQTLDQLDMTLDEEVNSNSFYHRLATNTDGLSHKQIISVIHAAARRAISSEDGDQTIRQEHFGPYANEDSLDDDYYAPQSCCEWFVEFIKGIE